jgi:hypothetical protein
LPAKFAPWRDIGLGGLTDHSSFLFPAFWKAWVKAPGKTLKRKAKNYRIITKPLSRSNLNMKIVRKNSQIRRRGR